MSSFRFRAVVTLNGAARGGRVAGHPDGTNAVVVHAGRLGQPGTDRYFEAAIGREDRQALHDEGHAVVTITVADGQALDFFAPGQHFALWDGVDVGTGVISRRVFTTGSPS